MDYERAQELLRYTDLRAFETLRELRAAVPTTQKYNALRRKYEAWSDALAFMKEMVGKFEEPVAEAIKMELPTFQ